MFSRIANLFKGFLSLFISGLERQNPRALIEAEKENLRGQIARFNENLANHAGFCERLLRQVKNLETQEREYAAKAAANLKVGNRNAAGQYALQLKTVKEQLDENRKQLEAAESTYQKLVKSRDVSVRDAQEKIEKLKRMMTETEMLEAQAELQEMATGMVSSIGGSGDTLNRVEEYLSERRDKAADDLIAALAFVREQGAQEVRLPLPLESAEPDDLALPRRHGNILDKGAYIQVLDVKRGFRRRVLDRVDGLADGLGHFAGHVEDDFVHFRAGQLDVGDRFAVSEDDGARRDAIDLTEPVCDHHDARAAGAEGGKPAQVTEEAFDFGVVQRCGHFVEQEVVRLPGHGLHDLDEAEDRGREVRRIFGESTGDAEPVEKELDEGLVRFFVDRAVAIL